MRLRLAWAGVVISVPVRDAVGLVDHEALELAATVQEVQRLVRVRVRVRGGVPFRVRVRVKGSIRVPVRVRDRLG